MEHVKTLLKGVLAGIAISFGGFLCIRNTILGSFLFSFGLILICNFGFNLYTGKVCYLFDNKEKSLCKRIFDLLIILLGNALGTLIFSLILKFSMADNNINDFDELYNK